VVQENKEILDKLLIKLVKENNPSEIRQLIELVKRHTMSISEKEILQKIIELENHGKLKFTKPKTNNLNYSEYLKNAEAKWYWLIILVSTATIIAVFAIQENSYPFVYARYALGSIFVVFLPGYCFVRTLFPKKEIETIERIALSVAMSLAIIPIMGLALNYTPWGITVAPLTISTYFITIILATIAIIREKQNHTNI
jgi:hypothetical protein